MDSDRERDGRRGSRALAGVALVLSVLGGAAFVSRPSPDTPTYTEGNTQPMTLDRRSAVFVAGANETHTNLVVALPAEPPE